MSTKIETPKKLTDTFDVENIRKDFPILEQKIHGKPLCYLDNAATAQKPLSVIETIDNYYRTMNSNIHRGVHTLSETATKAYEDARVKIKEFINAQVGKRDNLYAGNNGVDKFDRLFFRTHEHKRRR